MKGLIFTSTGLSTTGMKILISLFLILAVLLVSAEAEARCTPRVADKLITTRFQECNSKKLLSYLYNNIVTPYSYDCSKKVKEACVKEDCAKPKGEEHIQRCQVAYVQVLNGCETDLEGAAKMARCKDTRSWPVESYPGDQVDTVETHQISSRSRVKSRTTTLNAPAPQAVRSSQSTTRRQ